MLGVKVSDAEILVTKWVEKELLSRKVDWSTQLNNIWTGFQPNGNKVTLKTDSFSNHIVQSVESENWFSVITSFDFFQTTVIRASLTNLIYAVTTTVIPVE